jgi:hypothetical protein
MGLHHIDIIDKLRLLESAYYRGLGCAKSFAPESLIVRKKLPKYRLMETITRVRV